MVYLEFLLRMRAALLTLSPDDLGPHWTHIRRLLILIDPVSAGLWPHLRRRRGLTPTQQFARWIVIRAHPEAKPTVSLTDWRRMLCVFESGRRIRNIETRITAFNLAASIQGSQVSISNYHTEMTPTPNQIAGRRAKSRNFARALITASCYAFVLLLPQSKP
jgi:hypothetical protein